MQYTEAVLVKIDSDTKRQMKKLKVNWSEEIREFIMMRIKIGRKKNLMRAVAGTDRLFRKVEGFDSTAVIRKMRDTRYGPDSSR